MRTAPVYLSASAAFLLLLSCTPDPVSPHINHPPQASNLDLETDEDKSILIDVLENCSDRDGDSLSINAFSQGENGSVVKLDSDLFYTPDSNFNGPDELTYQVRDNRGGLDTGIVRISVNPVNDPPQARNDSTEVDEDDSIVVGVLKNDHDVDNDELSIVSIGPCSYGALSLFEDSVTYTPDPDFFGSDSFKYVINDGSDLSDTAVVYVTVIPLNDNPVASDDSASTEENAVLRIPVLENDRDDDRDSLFITRIGNCVNGKISLIKDTLVYTPDSFFNGRDSFDYVVGDGRGGIDSAVVYIEIIDVNFVPVAADDSLVTDEDSVSLVDVLGNDTDFDKDSIWIKTLGSAVHGNVSLKNDSVLYAPELNFFGSDSFTYVIMDESGDSSEATVYCKIIAVNDAPVAVDDTISAKEDESVSTAVLENDTDVDGDQLSIESFTQGTNGSVTRDGSSLVYTPESDFNGSDSYTYTVTDSNGGTATATVSVTITAVNDAPVAVDDEAAVEEDGSVSTAVLENDTDVDGDQLSIESFTQGTNGSVTRDGSSLVYTPASDFNGSDSYTYTVTDSNGGTATAMVSVTITAVNDAPVAVDDEATVEEDGSVSTAVLENDTDAEGDQLSIESFTQGTNGTVTQDGSSLVYTPDPDFNGSDSYTYITGDEHGDTASAAVHVTVNPVNDTPVANNDVVNVDEDGTVLINVLSNDTDVDKDILSIIGFTQGRNGTVTKEGSSLRYTPDADFNGSDEFSYDISDGNGGIATGMVTVAINSINDAPVAVDDDVEVDEDGTVIVDVTANDTDVDGDVVVISSFTHGTNGSVAQDDGSLRYEPDAGYYGSDSFTYTVSDGNGGISSATVYVNVNQKTLLSMDFDGVDSPTDYIEVNVPESGMHSFVTSYYRQSADTFMALYNGNKQLIAINDDYTSLYAKIHIELTQGTYYVRIDEFDGGALYCHLEVKRQ